ncbi:MAG: hypothetical protein EA344_09590 [Alkalicoccus sp.]|nr:MAG: hypothetical protein EA344_09590 [Alkalicoccus sp.]
MATQAVGAYNSEKELEKELDRLKQQGHREENMTVVASEEKIPNLFANKSAGSIKIEKIDTAPGGNSRFVAKLKDAINAQDEKDRKDKNENALKEHGLTQGEAEKYRQHVEEDKIVLLLEGVPEKPSDQAGDKVSSTEKEKENIQQRSPQEDMKKVQEEQQYHKHATGEAEDTVKPSDEDPKTGDRK